MQQKEVRQDQKGQKGQRVLITTWKNQKEILTIQLHRRGGQNMDTPHKT